MRAAGNAARDARHDRQHERQHLSPDAVTVFEALEDAGLVTAAVNITCYRGRTRHRRRCPGSPSRATGPRRFFFYNLFESDVTGAPLAVRPRGRLDRRVRRRRRALARHARRLRLPRLLPLGLRLRVARARARRARARRSPAATRRVGRWSTRPAAWTRSSSATRVVLCSDHGQTQVERAASLEASARRRRRASLVTASNRAGQVYRLPDGAETRDLRRAPRRPCASRRRALPRGGEAVARRDGRGAPLHAARTVAAPSATRLLDLPAPGAWAALPNPNAGEVLVSAARRVRARRPRRPPPRRRRQPRLARGGRLRGADARDRDRRIPARITDVTPAVLSHFGVRSPVA